MRYNLDKLNATNVEDVWLVGKNRIQVKILIFGTKCFIRLGDDKRSLLVELKSEKARCDQLEQNCDGLRDQLEKLRKEFNFAKDEHKNEELSYRRMIQDLQLENQNHVLEIK